MLRWKVNVLEALRANGYIPHKMRVERLFGEATIQKMRHQKLVSWAEFDRLCRLLDAQPGDLLEYVEEVKAGAKDVEDGL